MPKPEVLLTERLEPQPVMDALTKAFTVHHLWQTQDPQGLSRAVAPRVTGLVTTGGRGAEAELIDAPPRQVVAGDRWVRSGCWAQYGPMSPARSLSRRTVGFFGFGRVGQAIARKMETFGTGVLYHKPTPLADSHYEYVPDLTELARRCDDLLVCCVGGDATRHRVNAEVLHALGPEGTLINVSRGSVVGEAALIEALESGRLGAAALDVFDHEPHVPAALMAMDNVVLTPHLGSLTYETRLAMGNLVVDNLRAYFAGEPPLTPVA